MRKIVTFAVSIVSIVICIGITMLSSNVGMDSKLMNWAFFAGMLLLVLYAEFSGIRKLNKVKQGLKEGRTFLKDIDAGNAEGKDFRFGQKFLDTCYEEYKAYMENHGKADIAAFINGYDIGTYAGKRFLQIVPDMLTSAGILGTFIGLVIGLQEFDPSGYQQMSRSISPLIDGIKVAFVTSIYGLAFALPYSIRLSETLEGLDEQLERFLTAYSFHEEKAKEPYDDLVEGQKEQTEILRDLTETFTVQMADRFANVITPTFEKLGAQIDQMADNQKNVMVQAADAFAAQFRKTFAGNIDEFQEGLAKTGTLQRQYMEALEMSIEKMGISLKQGQDSVQEAVREMNGYFTNCARALLKNTDSQAKFIDGICKSLEVSAGNLKGQTESLGKNTEAVIAEIQRALDETRIASQNMKVIFQEVAGTAAGIEKAASGIEQSGNIFLHSAQKIQETAVDFSTIIQQNQKLAQNSAQWIQESAVFQQEMLRGMQDAQELLKALGKELSAYAEYFSSFPEQAQKESAADRQDSGQAELMKELLKEMRDLTEIARKRQERGVFRKFKKMLKRKRR